MAINGIDPAAKKPGRIRRNWNRTIKGAVASTLATVQPIAVDSSNRLNLNLATNPGLSAAGNALKILLDTTPGLVLGSGGIKILLDTSSGLVLGAGGVKVGLLTTKGDLFGFSTVNARIPVGTDGQLLTADSTNANGVNWKAPITSNATEASLATGIALAVSSNALSGVYQLAGPTITLAAAGTYLLTYVVHGALQSATVGDLSTARLFNITDNASIQNSELRLCTAQVANIADDHTSTGSVVLTIAAAKDIRVEAQWTTAGAGTPGSVPINSGAGGRTKITAIRLA